MTGGALEVDPKLPNFLVCPLTKGPLIYDRDRQELVSPEAGRVYHIQDGIPIMLVDEPGEAAFDKYAKKYPDYRRTESSIMRTIMAALGEATSVVNVGAGAGSYEPPNFWVVAIDPSPEMLSRRPPGSAPAVLGANIYYAFRKRMIAASTLDFGGLIVEALGLLRNNQAVRKQVQRVYSYICVDEFQDTNRSQYDILTSLVNTETKNLFVVADDDQIIYQWNGASPERLETLKNDFSMTVLQLPANYRCPPKGNRTC